MAFSKFLLEDFEKKCVEEGAWLLSNLFGSLKRPLELSFIFRLLVINICRLSYELTYVTNF